MKFSSIEEGIKDFKEGKMIIVVDNEDRENEGDLVILVEMVIGENINFMIKYVRGFVCVFIEEEIVIKLGLNFMVERNIDNYEIVFIVVVDYKDIIIGILVFERVYIINKFVFLNELMDFRRLGYVFLLIVKKKGVLERIGYIEVFVDLVKFVGFKGVVVICEIVNDDGNMVRRDDLMIFVREYNLKILIILDFI